MPVTTYSGSRQQRHTYASSGAEDRRDSAVEGEEDEEDEDESKEEEQRPLCSGVLGYPVVRDHTLGLGLSTAPDEAGSNAQSQSYKGENNTNNHSGFYFN